MDDFDFLNPDYTIVWQQRSERLSQLRSNPEILLKLKEFYKDNPVNFINDWGCTFDPRNAEIGIETVVPFILFPKQAEFVKWVYDRWSGREDGLAEKSRDMGVSWLCVAVAAHMMLFYEGVVVGFGSRKEEYVDKLGDPKSLFWKVREFIKLLPAEFRPSKFEAPFMRICNGDNGSTIVGESGDNIGRGNRTSIYFKDESAFYERPDAIDAALSQTSNCKIDVSTPNGNGNAFYRKRMAGKIARFTFHWRDDPRKDDAWYRKQCDTLDPVIVAQEIDIDYNASTSDAWIDGSLIERAQAIKPADVEINGPWFVGVDAAHFGDDESVIHFRRGRFNDKQVFARKLDGQDLAGRVVDEIDNRLASGSPLGAIVIELDGPGVSCYDALMRSPYGRFVVGVHTGARQSDNQNYNLRAKIWRAARDYLEEGGCIIDRDAELKSQLSSVKYSFRDGLLLMQSKKEYKKEYGKSPDRADAFILSFGSFGQVVINLPRQAESVISDSDNSLNLIGW